MSPLVKGSRRAPRVLIVVQNLPFEFDRRVRTEAAALRAAGYGVSVICPKKTPDEPDLHDVDGIRIRSYRSTGRTSGLWSYVVEFVVCWLRAARRSWQVQRSEGFDVLQACNPPDTYWLLGLLWKVAGKRFVYDQHDLCPEVYEARFGRRGSLYRMLLVLEKATYRTADHVISTNPFYQEIALDRGHVPPERSSVVMSTPVAAMVRGQVLPQLRHGRKHLVVYVGIMGPQDGVVGLVDAIEHYVHVLGRDDAHFAILGFGDALPGVRARVREHRLEDFVTFSGRVNHAELGRWLSTASVGVTPDPVNEFNHRSTMNKTLEYMAHGVPLVATDLLETRRCAAEAAIYASDGAPSELAKGIATLLDDPVKRRRMGRLGRLRIERELAWSRQAAVYTAVFDTVLGRAAHGVATGPAEAARVTTSGVRVPAPRQELAPLATRERE